MSTVVRLVMASGLCPLWLSAALLNWQALEEMHKASERQVMHT